MKEMVQEAQEEKHLFLKQHLKFLNHVYMCFDKNKLILKAL